MRSLIMSALAAMLVSAPAFAQQLSDEACGVSVDRYMNLSAAEFDQDLGHGWREIADKPGCERAGADLIALYRDQKLAEQMAGLDWHEAQLRAAAGEIPKALALFQRNLAFRKQMAAYGGVQEADVLYAEATIAFLDRDATTLRAKRAELATLPRPDWFDRAAASFKLRYPDARNEMTWPTNLDVVDGLVACFDRPYAEAYGFGCRPKPTASRPN